MPITNEMIQERQAAAAEFEAADIAAKEADARLAAAKTRLDAAHEAIGAQMQDGDTLTLLPQPVPAIRKKDGKVEAGFIDSIHTQAAPA